MEKARFIRACREGGHAIEQALRELDRTLFAPLYRDGLRTLRDPDAARDLVQDTFIKVWRRCASFRGESELLPWIKSILRNAAFERLRRTVREVAIEDEQGLTADAAEQIAQMSLHANGDPETLAHQQQGAEEFGRAWQRFEQADPLHANVMRWVVEDGLSTNEIAQLLGRTPAATREFISQCRKRARRYLAQWYVLASDGGHPA